MEEAGTVCEAVTGACAASAGPTADADREADLLSVIQWIAGRPWFDLACAAHNLGVLMRSLFKMGTPRGLQQFRTDLEGLVSSLRFAWIAATQFWKLQLPSSDLLTGSCKSPANETGLALVA